MHLASYKQHHWPQSSITAKRIFLALLCSLVSFCLIACGNANKQSSDDAQQAPAQPNFVLVFTDDQGYSDIGVYGSTDIRTPNLDRMANEGIRFSSFYAQPVCGPSRAALLTGSYPIRVAEPDNKKNPNSIIHPKELTIAETLKSVGYRTAVIGKWHMAGDGEQPWEFAPPPRQPDRPGGKGPFKPELMPNAQGFDYFYGTPMYHGYTLEADHQRFIPELMRNQEVVESPADINTLTQKYTHEAITFIRENEHNPFFIYLAHHMPHVPLGASENFKGKSNRGLYGDAVEELDWSMNEIFRTLRELKLDENTLVVFLSDNGPELQYDKTQRGDAIPLRGGKYSNWEGGVRVPAIMRWPGQIPAGIISDALATSMDLYPTFAALAGAEIPQQLVIDGQDIQALLFNEADAQHQHRTFFYYSLTQLHGVRSGRWKLVLPRLAKSPYTLWLGRYTDAVSEPLLFDLEADVEEHHNLAPEKPEIVQRLMEAVEWARAELGDYNRIGASARFFDEGPKRPRTYFPESE